LRNRPIAFQVLLLIEAVMNEKSSAPYPMRGVHDLGGLALGPIDRDEHQRTPYEKRVHAIEMLLVNPARGVFKSDELRRVLEGYSPTEYESLSYYDRWIKAVRILLVEQQVLSEAEIDQRIAAINARRASGYANI
jgi:hypothetical protein